VNEDTVIQIKTAINTVEYIGRYVNLQKRGHEYVGLCPFHSEKTPSFYVHPTKGVYYCFGCHASGDLIEFVKEYEGVSFVDAIQILANEAGIEVEVDHSDRVSAISILSKIWDRWQQNAARVGRFLDDRDLPPDTPVGYDTGDWLSDVDADVAIELGLAYQSNRTGQLVSKFRYRAIFPVFVNGRLVGVTARALSSRQKPKWMHSRFNRQSVLFGLDEVRARAKEFGAVVVVEGPIDALRLRAVGIPAVALFGTALTANQTSRLEQLGLEVWLGFDRDAAGLKASLKALDALRGRVIVKPVVWPRPYKDPGEIPASELAQAVRPMPVEEYLYRYAEHVAKGDIAKQQRWLARWLEPASDADPIPSLLRRYMTDRGYVLSKSAPTKAKQKDQREKIAARAERERLLEADIAAVLFSVNDPQLRKELTEYVELSILPSPGDLLVAVLDALDTPNPIRRLRELGAGTVFAVRIMSAKPYTADEARSRLVGLVRHLSHIKTERALRQAIDQGDFERAMEYASILEVLRRERYDGR